MNLVVRKARDEPRIDELLVSAVVRLGPIKLRDSTCALRFGRTNRRFAIRKLRFTRAPGLVDVREIGNLPFKILPVPSLTGAKSCTITSAT